MSDYSVSSQDAPLGADVPEWRPPPAPERTTHEGAWMRLEPLDASLHGAALFDAYAGADAVWDYLPYGPFATKDAYLRWLEPMAASKDPLFFAICPRSGGGAAGVLSYLRVTPVHGVIEIGHLNFAPRLQQTPAASEAVFTLIDHAFALGYRRVEWKCNALNAASRRAAERFGFQFEGVFRQMMVVKGRNRDSAWFSIIDREWPALAEAHRQWLSPENFDADGRQRRALSELTAAAR